MTNEQDNSFVKSNMMLLKATKKDMARQIENRLAHTDKATLIRLIATLDNGFDSRKCSPFDLLPDEIVMKIIYMTLGGCGKQKHNCLAKTIAMISTRFQNLAADKSMWRGIVSVKGDASKLQLVINHFLNDEVKELKLTQSYGPTWYKALPKREETPTDIKSVAEKCPNIEKLTLTNFNLLGCSWPTSIWASLKELTISGIVGDECFKGIDLHASIPNLEYFQIPVWANELKPCRLFLPDMSSCARLEEVYFGSSPNTRTDYTLQSESGNIPFPKTLKKLGGEWSRILSWDKTLLIKHFYSCEISEKLNFYSRQ